MGDGHNTIPEHWWLSLKNYRVRVNLWDSLEAGRDRPRNGPNPRKGYYVAYMYLNRFVLLSVHVNTSCHHVIFIDNLPSSTSDLLNRSVVDRVAKWE